MENREYVRSLLQQTREVWKQQPYAAYARYEDLLQRYPGCAMVLREYGKAVFMEMIDFEKAIIFLEQALKREPNAILTWFYLGISYGYGYGKGYPGEIAVYRSIIEHFPEQTQACVAAYLRIGASRQAPGVKMSIQEAVEAFRQAVQLDPQCPEAYQCLAQGLHDAGDWGGAYEALQQVIRLRKQQQQPYEHLLDRLQALKERIPWKGGFYSFPDVVLHWPDEELE